MRIAHGHDGLGGSWGLLRRAANVVEGRFSSRRRAEGGQRAGRDGQQTAAATAVAELPAASEYTLPDELAYGQCFRLPDGLELTVTAIELDSLVPPHVVIEVSVANPSEKTAFFENNFGVLDATGTAHRYTWVSSEKDPDVLPGIASLEAAAVLGGKVHIVLPELPPEALASLRPAFLTTINSGCGGCFHAVVLLPRALWQAAAFVSPEPTTAAEAAPPL